MDQNRSDRNKYVKYAGETLERIKKQNFRKYSKSVINHFNLPYDYEVLVVEVRWKTTCLENTQSVLHYWKYAFSKNARITIKTLDPTKQNVIGSAKGVRI